MKDSHAEEHFKFRLPKETVDAIREYVTLNDDLYTSYIDFCIEAVRRRLDEIHYEMQEKERMKNLSVLARANAIREKLDKIRSEDAKRNDEEIKKVFTKQKD